MANTIIETLYADPASPTAGQMWFRADLVAGFIPAAPSTGFSIAAGDTKITLTVGTVGGATSYNAYYTADGSTPTKSHGTKLTGVTNGQEITGLVNGTAYKLVFTAVGVNGESAEGAVLTATPGIAEGPFTVTFDDASWLDKFTPSTVGSGVANITDLAGNLHLNGPDAGTDGALAYRTLAVTPARAALYKIKIKVNTTDMPVGGAGTLLQLVHSAAKGAPLNTGDDSAINMIDCLITNSSGTLKQWFRYTDNVGGKHEKGTDAGWTAAGVGTSLARTVSADTYYWVYLYTTLTGWSVELRAADDTTVVLAKTTEILWSATVAVAGGESAWLRTGDKYSNTWKFGSYVDTYVEA